MHIKKISWLILLLMIKYGAFAQDTVMVISPALYEDVEEIYPAKLQGWYFKQGSDTAWAAKNLDIKGWKKMRPVDLSVALTDANGKVEGWFRGSIKIDSSFGNTPLSLLFGVWAAQDIYIDGKKIASTGNTGSNGLPYEENVKFDRQGIVLPELKAGSIHTIAWHITDSRGVPFNGDKLKGAERGLYNLLEFASPRFFTWQYERKQFIWQIQTAIIACEMMFVLLFWLLWGLNKEQKNILYFALFTSFLAIYFMSGNINANLFFSFRFSYTTNQWINFFRNMLICPLVGFASYILAQIFNHKLGKKIPALILISTLVNAINFLFLQQSLIVASLIIFCLSVSMYIIATSLKKAKAADWAVITGIFLTILFNLLGYLVTRGIYNYKIGQLVITGFYLSFPLSLLVYVAIRFRQIIGEVRYNADQVIKLSDEKRIQAEQQQQILELQVKERTQELEHKNRELEIETALEKVRGRAMAMQKAEELLEVIAVVSEQLEHLGLFFSHANFRINEGEKDWDLWSHFKWIGLPVRWQVKYIDHPFFNRSCNNPEETIIQQVFTKEETVSVEQYLFEQGVITMPENPEEKKIMQQYLEEGVGFAWSVYRIKNLSLAVANHYAKPYNDEENNIIKRFTIVFVQAYSRFLDLQKAEAQAKEAQIENALERVRSRSLGMQKSDELSDVVAMVFQQLNQFLFKTDGGVSIVTDFMAYEYADMWVAADTLDKPVLVRFPYTKNPIPSDFTTEKLKGTAIYSKRYDGQVIKDNWQQYFEMGLYKDIPEETKQWILSREVEHFTVAFEERSAITVATYEDLPPTEGQKLILKRFAKVFEQSYIRFLDLQKAEEQARESEIELALERIRAKSMAMQKSAELLEVIKTVTDQLVNLGIKIDATFFFTPNPDKSWLLWLCAREENFPVLMYVPYFDHPLLSSYFKARENKQSFYSVFLSREEAASWHQHFFEKCVAKTTMPELTNERIEQIFQIPNFISFNCLFDRLNFGVCRFTAEEFSETEKAIFIRIGKVFDQAYTRFLDLQKAEEQARESEIELALERIRAKSMAMQKSTELLEVIKTVTDQLLNLSIEMNGTYFFNVNPDKSLLLWLCTQEENFPVLMDVPYFDHPLLTSYFKARENNQNFYSVFLSREEAASWHQHFFEKCVAKTTMFETTNERIEQIFQIQNYLTFNCLFDRLSFGVYRFTAQDFLETEKAIFIRIGKVFDQAYIRFLDLQKAEDQAREAQIEAALEKVRSRSLAMHHSDELKEVITEVLLKLQELGVAMESKSAIICLYKEGDKEFEQWVASPEHNAAHGVQTTFFDSKIHNDIWDARNNGTDFYAKSYSVEEKNAMFHFFFDNTDLRIIPEKEKTWLLEQQYYELASAFEKHSAVMIANFTADLLDTRVHQILKRFAKVFEQAYIRFMDLQKAEAQARESQIEAALERVRAHAMALRDSHALSQVIHVIFEELQKLSTQAYEAGIYLRKGQSRDFEVWAKSVTDDQFFIQYDFPFVDHFILNKVVNNLDNQVPYAEFSLSGDEIKSYGDLIFSLDQFSNVSEEYKKSFYTLEKVYVGHAYFKHGFLEFSGLEQLPADLSDIMKRFTQVIDLAYTRFLDLQKAEAQAREAQIEAALERVRSKTMAMHNSEEVGESVVVMFNELTSLGLLNSQARCGIGIMHPDHIMESWTARNIDNKTELSIGYLNMEPHPLLRNVYQSWLNHQDFCNYILEGEDRFKYIEAIRNQRLYNASIEFYAEIDKIFQTSFFCSEVSLYVFRSQEISESEKSIFLRFVNVFSQTYRRYKDLQKAEAQAREAQIENALEKIRSRSLAMHSSDELKEVVNTVYERIQFLQIDIDSFTIIVTSENEQDYDYWIANEDTSIYPSKISVPRNGVFSQENPVAKEFFTSWANHANFSKTYSFAEKNEHWLSLFKNSGFKEISEKRKQFLLSTPAYALSIAFTKNAALVFAKYQEKQYSEKENNILQRFANVFEQSYIRFLDLQKAEAQAKEAQIEAGLERVRSRTMAMQRSGELTETVKLLFEEFKKFHTEPDMANLSRGFITTINKEKKCFDLWITDIHGNEIKQYFKIDFTEPTTGIHIYKGWKNKAPNVIIDLQGEELNEWLDYLSGLGFPVAPGLYGTRRVNNFIYHSKGFIGVTTSVPLTTESIRLLERFAKVFDLTYTRFVDLQNAEARALLAVREASLDRVRAEIASMRHAEDLKRITPLVWRELTALGVPFFRCGVLIMDEQNTQTHFYLTTPDGKSLAVLNLGIESSDIIKEAWAHWQMQKVYTHFWTKEAFIQFAQTLLEQGQIKDQTGFQGGEAPPESITLQFIPFAQGMLYVGSAAALEENQIESVKTLADAFETAYARYEDFTKLESAKAQIENTLKDLRATQTQLIQSEKMASLGDLTAGIAHEIQNPLNFVNNFSEVSTELIDEMNEEIEKGNLEDARQIAEDLKQNLEKINHHGKRAGDIVKGMLQHSRSSSGQKEPTDINALCDEYLRLAYHGLRAKDKSFNASFEIKFDETIGKINIQPQEMGRVILNLINNAFYAVATPQPPEGGVRKEPTVTISTSIITPPSGGRGVMISVADNGPGIPPNIVDKIFQPFFTTKPTGQGTGLGLSLSYDIVKAHGGELQVETKEGNGTTFVILLPV